MNEWFRVFGKSEAPLEMAALLEHLDALGLTVKGRFWEDDLGWFRAEFRPHPDAEPLLLERFLTDEEEIRAELNSWAAWLETREDCPHHARLMEQVIQTRQLFTMPRRGEGRDGFAVALCRYLASVTDGVYQVDGEGFFAANGTLLVEER
jgi:hypothetical protein